ncbi:MAG: mechanosensitive ion channel family protein [Gammaproteobacteria bacterium]|nr:mechanosensitive ion channel family protein [Gammaproteobacteria bacterium]
MSTQSNFDQIKPYLTLFGENVYLQAAGILVSAYVIGKLINLFLGIILHRLANKSQSQLDDQIIRLLRPPVFYSILIISFAIAVKLVFTESIELVVIPLFETVAVIIWTVLTLRISRLLIRASSQQVNKFTLIHAQTLPLFENLAMMIIVALSLYFVFFVWNIDMTAWLASAGILGIAIGFASKDTLANLFSGVFILADAPYKIGDFIVLDSGERGEVTHIGIRSTRILTRDDVEVTIPNSIMGNSKISNESGGPHKKYRIRIKVGVAYGTDIDEVKTILMAVANNEESVCKDPEPRIRFRQFGASSLDFELLCWIIDPVLRGRVIDLLNTTIYKKFQELDIEIPYAKQDVYIKSLPNQQEK